MGDELYVWSFAATRASARELKERSCKLRVLHIGLNINEVLLAGDFVNTEVPIFLVVELRFEVSHLEGLVAFLAWTNVNTVAATETVEDVDSLNKVHTGECLADSWKSGLFGIRRCCEFVSCKHEWTNCSVRTNVCTLVTLDTVFSIPFRNESSHTTLFVFGGACMPCAVFDALECRNREKVAILSVDRTYNFVDECRIVVCCSRFNFQRSPCRVDGKCLVFVTAVNSLEVLVDNVLPLLAI